MPEWLTHHHLEQNLEGTHIQKLTVTSREKEIMNSLHPPTYSYLTPGLLLDFTRTPANFILADHHTTLVSQSYWSPSKFLLDSSQITRNCRFLRNGYTGVQLGEMKKYVKSLFGDFVGIQLESSRNRWGVISTAKPDYFKLISSLSFTIL